MPKENQNSETKTKTHGVDEAIRYHAQLAVAEAELRKKLYGSRNRGIRETMKFGFTTAIIFAISFSALNFSAYTKQATFWLNNLRADVVAQDSGETKLKVKEVEVTPAKTKVELPPILAEVSPADNRIVIEKFNVFAPIQEAVNVDFKKNNWEEIEAQVQDALKSGVVHFPGSAEAGERGNAFYTGHSSYYPWSDGRYKDVFALLPQIQVGDIITIWENQKRYDYKVSEVKEVKPSETDVLAKTDDYRLTLMTCTPIGTSLRRLIVTAQLVK
jgi:LPXTG-site transpeptidase (sortase) family protein